MNTSDNTLNFPAPNMAIMAASRTVINNQVAALKLDFLPVIKEKLLPLQRALTQADSVLRQELGTLTVRFRSAPLERVEQQRQQLEAEPRLSEEQRNRAMDLLDKEHARIVAGLEETLRSSTRNLAASLDDLAQINIEIKDNLLRDSLKKQLDSLTQDITELQSKLSTLAEDRRLLDDTIKTFEKLNLADMFKEMLPTIDDLKALSLPSPELALAEAGLARLNRMLGHLGRGLTYLDLINERDRVRASYNEALDQSRELDSRSRKLVGDMEEVDGIDSAHRSKLDWVREAGKAIESLRTFRETHLSAAAPRLSASLARQLVSYISSFYSIEREA